MHVSPGATVSVSFDWAVNRNGYCPGCNEQILGGLVKIDTTVIPGSISAGSSFEVGYNGGNPSGGNLTFTFTAPRTVGTYYIGLYADLQYGCSGALNASRANLGLETFIAAITVY